MVLLIAVAIGVVVGLLTGGSFAGFSNARFRYLPVIFFSLIVQVLIFTPLIGNFAIIHRVGPYIYITALAAGLFFLVKNLTNIGMWIILVGAALNFIVITLNGGYMPTTEEALRTAGRLDRVIQIDSSGEIEKHATFTNSTIANDDTKLLFLGDVIAIPERFPLANVISFGDVLIAFGATITVALVMRLKPEEKDEESALDSSATEQVSG